MWLYITTGLVPGGFQGVRTHIRDVNFFNLCFLYCKTFQGSRHQWSNRDNKIGRIGYKLRYLWLNL